VLIAKSPKLRHKDITLPSKCDGHISCNYVIAPYARGSAAAAFFSRTRFRAEPALSQPTWSTDIVCLVGTSMTEPFGLVTRRTIGAL
jgi:hypothetical protein